MNIISLKENIKKYYDAEADVRDANSIKPDWKVKVRKRFCDLINQENKNTLLELGAGAGYDSLYFKENGLKVVAVDLSSEMVKKCKEKSIEAYELDFYKLSTLNRKFDCIYAINTLLHVPNDDLSHVLKEIDSALDSKGLFFLGMYGGDDIENEFIKSEVSDAPRFFALRSENYLRVVLAGFFQIQSFETMHIGTEARSEIFHSIILRKKNKY